MHCSKEQGRNFKGGFSVTDIDKDASYRFSLRNFMKKLMFKILELPDIQKAVQRILTLRRGGVDMMPQKYLFRGL